MRIKKLHLKRYGHFEDCELEFPECGVTVIYGPNEAGKSTSLSAISDALYGFGHTTNYGFRFDPQQLRIGATLVNQQGKNLSYFRKKGNKDTVRDLADLPIADSALAPYLGLSQKETFENTFGLSHDRLRQGGDAIASSKGDLGKILFEAGSGITQLADIQKELDEQADEIFGSRKKASRVLYQSIEAYDKAARELKESSIKRADWTQAKVAVSSAEDALAAVREKLRVLMAEQTRLHRWQRVLPILRELETLRSKLDDLGRQVNLPLDSRERYARIVEQRRHSTDQIAQIQTQLQNYTSEAEACLVDSPLMAARASIQLVFEQIAVVEAEAAALPIIDHELREVEQQISARLRELDLPLVNGEPYIPGRLDKIMLPELIMEREKIDAAKLKLAADAAETDHLLNEIHSGLKDIGEVADPAASDAEFQRIRTTLAAVGDLRKQKRDLNRLEKKMAEIMVRLPWWQKSGDSLLKEPLPSPVQVDRHRKQLDRSEKDHLGALEKLECACSELSAARHAMEAYRKQEEFATDEELAAARKRREETWLLVRRVLETNCKTTPAETAPATSAEILIPTYEELAAKADKMADIRLESAEKIAQHKLLEQQVSTREHTCYLLEIKLAKLAGALDAEKSAWLEFWALHDITPRSPEEMAEGISLVASLREAAASRDELQEELAQAHAQIRASTEQLRVLAQKLSIGSPGNDAGALLPAIETALLDQKKQFADASNLRARLYEQQAMRAKHQREMEQAAQRTEHWQARWSDCCSQAKIKAELSPAQVGEILQAWDELSRRQEQKAALQARHERAELIIQQFQHSVAALCHAVGASRHIATVADTVSTARQLHADLIAMEGIAARRTELDKRLNELKDAANKQQTLLADADTALAALMELSGTDAEDGLVDAIAQAEQQRHMQNAIDSAAARLVEAAAGQPEEELRAETATASVDTLTADVSDLLIMMAEAEKERDEAHSAAEEAKAALRALERKSGGESLAQEMQNAIAKMHEQTRNYLRLGVASLLLKSGLEKIREKHKNPILARASTLFRDLTCGSFHAVTTDYDAADKPTLTGVRSDGTQTFAHHMSDGTRDQLYLALRLAFVDNYCATNEPLPFIGDDLFVHFDDTRTAAGLKLLAGLASCQIILFTHHQHLAQLSKDVLGSSATVLNLSA